MSFSAPTINRQQLSCPNDYLLGMNLRIEIAKRFQCSKRERDRFIFPLNQKGKGHRPIVTKHEI